MPSGYLHTDGACIVAADGAPVRLAGVNWYGFEAGWTVPGGLDVRSIDDICELVTDLGFNHVRLPYCDAMVMRDPVVKRGLHAMPALQGRRALDVMDAVIDSAARHRLKVVLDSHRSTPGWSAQGNGLWYSSDVSPRAWKRSLTLLARRYAGNDTVVAVDLRNEPGSPATNPEEWPGNGGAVWGEPDGPFRLRPRDWARAAEDAGNAVLACNPDLLVIVEGVRADPAGPVFDGATRLYWPGGNLAGVGRAGGRRPAAHPITLDVAGRLVYSVHDYGPAMDSGMPWCQPGTTAMTPAACREVWEQAWGFIERDGIAPVYVGEFGTPSGLWPGDLHAARDYTDERSPDPQTRWLGYLVDYIAELGLSWAYWPLNGTNSPGDGRDPGAVEGYGIADPQWSKPSNPSLLERLGAIRGPLRYPRLHGNE